MVESVISAFGLAGSAGLNAYIPLLIVSVLGKLGILQLSQPYDTLTSWWVIGILIVLGGVEFFADKIPGADSVNDVIQTFVRPAAGAILFAANTGTVTGIDPILAMGAGLIVATGVHATKAAARPVINTATLGVGAPVVSVIEDITSFIASFLAIFLPAIFLLFVVACGYVVYRLIRRVRRAKSQEA
jgi:hypothetical protein